MTGHGHVKEPSQESSILTLVLKHVIVPLLLLSSSPKAKAFGGWAPSGNNPGSSDSHHGHGGNFTYKGTPAHQGASTQSATCNYSELGYQCSWDHGPITLHWSVNSPVPINQCTMKIENPVGAASVVPTIHFAVEAQTPGYLGVTFIPSGSRSMYPGDAVIGWASPDAAVFNYYVTQNTLSSSDLAVTPWAFNMAVIGGPYEDVIVCFSRQFEEARARVTPILSTVGSTWMAYELGVGNGETGLQLLASSTGVFQIVLAPPSSNSNGSTIVAGAGSSAPPPLAPPAPAPSPPSAPPGGANSGAQRGEGPHVWGVVHGLLMALAWVVVVPGGVLIARHRWLLRDTRVWGLPLWLFVHLSLMAGGCVMILSSTIIALTQLPTASPTPGDANTDTAHRVLGYGVVALLGVQLFSAPLSLWFTHPPHQRLWLTTHLLLGRLTIVASWANIFLGIYLRYCRDPPGMQSYLIWALPVTVIMCAAMLADLVLFVTQAQRDMSGLEGGMKGGAGNGEAQQYLQLPALQYAVHGPTTDPEQQQQRQQPLRASRAGSLRASGIRSHPAAVRGGEVTTEI